MLSSGVSMGMIWPQREQAHDDGHRSLRMKDAFASGGAQSLETDSRSYPLVWVLAAPCRGRRLHQAAPPGQRGKEMGPFRRDEATPNLPRAMRSGDGARL